MSCTRDVNADNDATSPPKTPKSGSFMKPRPATLCVLILLLTMTACTQPDFHDTDGKAYRYSDFTGRWLLVNYWATWCAPCIKEIPELAALDSAREDVVVLGVNYDLLSGADDSARRAEQMARDIATMNITFPVLSGDPSAALGVDRPAVLPTTLVIDPDGNLHSILTGPQTQASLLMVMGLW